MRARSFSVVSSVKPVVFGLHDQRGRFLGREAVMIGKGLAARERKAGRARGREELLRIADAGEGEHACAPCRSPSAARSGTSRP